MLKWPRRITLFILTNALVIMTLGLLLNLLGAPTYLAQRGIDYRGLLVMCTLWGFGGAFISLLASRFMAKTFMGVQVIDPENPGGPSERWLLDTVYRLAHNAGLETMPEVGIFDSRDPNAFATGATKNSSLVAVSSGLLQSMEKDEVEGVLGHELTHVANGDMVTMTLLQGVINSFVFFLSWVGAILLTQGRRDDDRGGGWFMQYMLRNLLQFVFGMLGLIPLMAFSRWREYRADAGGAKLAGRPKMINALKALQGLKLRPSTNEPASVKTLMIFGSAGSIFASHPPLEDRIRRLQTVALPSVISE